MSNVAAIPAPAMRCNALRADCTLLGITGYGLYAPIAPYSGMRVTAFLLGRRQGCEAIPEGFAEMIEVGWASIAHR